ncbi:MAG: tetratricopeptide repeat protein, partial [Bacteroidales bacterium]|nr:tetratricopeptide repeat protein [Bacteroidales bacterium]
MSVTLYINEKKLTLILPGLVINFFDDWDVEDYLVKDIYGLFNELIVNDTCVFEPFQFQANSFDDYYTKAKELFVSKMYFLSNSMLYSALKLGLTKTDTLDAFNYLGYNYRVMKQYYRSNSYLQKAVNLNPEYPFAYWWMGHNYYEMKDYEKALELFIKIEDTDNPDYIISIHYNIASTYYILEQDDLALKYYKKALSHYDLKEDVYYYIALLYGNSGNNNEAISYYDSIHRQNPRDTNLMVYLCYFNYKAGEDALITGNYNSAKSHLDLVNAYYIDSLNSDPTLYSLISDYNNLRRLTYLYLNDYNEVARIIEQGLNNEDFSVKSIYRDNAEDLSVIETNDNLIRNQLIIEYFQKHAELNPGDTTLDHVFNSIGYYYSLSNNIDKSAEYFE